MKITPLEIRQKEFEKKLRGYDKDEVDAFLQSLSNEWERLIDENSRLQAKLEEAQKDVQKLREVESSLYKALKTAEDTGANMIDQANKSAELQLREAQMNAEAVLNDAKQQAKSMIEEAELIVRNTLGDVKEQIKDLERDFRSIENHRDNVVMQLKNLASDTIERVKRVNDQKTKLDLSKVPDTFKIGGLDLDAYQVSKPEDLIINQVNEGFSANESKEGNAALASPILENDKDEDTNEIANQRHSEASVEGESKEKPEPEKPEEGNKGSFFDQI